MCLKYTACASCWVNLPPTQTLHCFCLSSLHTNTFRCKPPPSTNLSPVRILNHLSISPPPFHLQHTWSPTVGSLFLCLCFSSYLMQPTPGDRAGEILMCSVKCCCLESCPDPGFFSTPLSLSLLWTVEEAKQSFSVSGRAPQGSAQDNLKACPLCFSLSCCLLHVNDSWVQCLAYQESFPVSQEGVRYRIPCIAWSGGGRSVQWFHSFSFHVSAL